MEWNSKPAPSQWNWENPIVFPGKIGEISKRVQLADWGIEEDGGIDNGSFQTGSIYSSGGGCGGSGSDLGSGFSSKSSISASVDSSAKASIKRSDFNFKTIGSHGIKGGKGRDMGGFDLCCLVSPSIDMRKEARITEFKSDQNSGGKHFPSGGLPRDPAKKKDCTTVEDTRSSSAPLAPNGSGEALLGLKLGKRTYFEDSCVGSTIKASSFSTIPASSSISMKKSRAPYQGVQNARCQVEGCNIDLSSSKDYHRRHKVCETHSKSPKVIVAGQERRFCQQCSRFHDLLEFDEKKRSCRRRLSDHNARRRKQQPEAISFNSASMSSSLYDGRQQVNFVVDSIPLVPARALANPTWEGAYDVKFAQAKGSWTEKAGGFDSQFHMPGSMDLPNAISALRNDFDRSLPFKGTAAEILDQGLEMSLISNLTATPDPRRALSLLSNNSWSSPDPEPISLDQLVHVTDPSINQPTVHALHQGSPFTGSVIWPAEQSAHEVRTHPSLLHNSGSQFQEFQLFRVPYESAIFDSNQLQ